MFDFSTYLDKIIKIVYYALVEQVAIISSFFHGNLIEAAAAAAFHWTFVCFVIGIGNGNGNEAWQFGSKDTHIQFQLLLLLPLLHVAVCSLFASRIKLIMAK